MKVLLLNGSHHQNGNTALALEEAAKALEAEGVETELFQIGSGADTGLHRLQKMYGKRMYLHR